MTAAELEKMSEHVRYEVDELRKAAQKVSKLKKDDSEWNNTIESVLLHFRNLRAFFFGEGNKPDDVFAKHYVAAWNPKKDPIFDNTKVDIDKRLTHFDVPPMNRSRMNVRFGHETGGQNGEAHRRAGHQ